MKIKALVLVIFFLLTVFAVVFSVTDPAGAENKQTKSSETQIDILQKEALQKMESENYQDAIVLYSRILMLQPKNTVTRIIAHFKRGNAYFFIGEYKKAIEDNSKAIDLSGPFKNIDDYKAQFHFNRGLAYDKTGDLNHAIDDYTRAISLDSNFVKAYNNRAVAYYKVGKYREAIEDCNKYLTFDKKNSEMYYVRGLSKIDLKDGSGMSGIDDLKIAAAMGHKYAQETLHQAGIK